MNLFVSEISKYVMVLLMAIYTLESFLTLKYKEKDHRRGIYIRESMVIFALHTLGMFCVYAISENNNILVLYFVEMMALFAADRIAVIAYERLNRQILNHLKICLVIGFIIQARLSYEKALRQFIIIVISLVLFLIVPFMVRKLRFLTEKRMAYIYGFVGAFLLALVYGMGATTYGSKLSIDIFGLTFQPSEFVKIIFVFFLAGLLRDSAGFGRIVVSGLLSSVYIFFLVVSKDLGTALIYCMIYLAIVFYANGKKRYLAGGLALGAGACVLAYQLFDHIKTRVAIWLDPWSDIENTGYQLAQSLFGIGTGDWFGRGIGRGMPQTIPFVDEDFVFSAIAEEMGVIFGILLILVLISLILHFLLVASRSKNSFYQLVAVGITASYGIQSFLTIAGGSKLIPLTGVTLPLISNGGSSVMATIIMYGIMLGISGDKEDEWLEGREKHVWILGILYTFMFLLMIGNLVKFMLTEKDQVVGHSYNSKRQQALATEIARGNIYAADGTVLARTVMLEDGSEAREYPYGDLYAHVIGYTSNGGAGVELSANAYLLRSSIDMSNVLSNQWNGKKSPGDNVFTTLDPELQQIAYDSLGIYRGAVIVTDAETGAVLAMVSKPDFDPGTVENNWSVLSCNIEDSPLLNRVTQGLYPPGSTFKIFTALEYMREYPDTFEEYSYTCRGRIERGDSVINCYHSSVHGTIDFVTSFAKSCNSSFANIGMSLDRSLFADTLISLYFNRELPIPFQYRPSHISMREGMTDSEIMQTSIGQSETVVTPIYLNMITQAIANEGIMMTPYVIDHVENYDGLLVYQNQPVMIERVISAEEAQYLTYMMSQVVECGTATKLSGQSYTAAGKTGSAEYSEEKGRSHAWFTGFAPVENPEIVVTVIMEGAGSGGDYAAPIARRIFSAYFAD